MQERQQVADPLLAGESVWNREVGLDRVVIATPDAPAGKVADVGELGDDPVGGALGDSDRIADLAQADAWVARDAQQHLGMVGEEGPGG